MTNLGSLTTTFTPPASCTTNTPQIYQVWEGTKSQYIHGPLYTTDSNCFPDGYDANLTNYYNPGFCPKGYTAAPCSHSGFPVTETGAAGETRTAVVCCPSGAYLTFTCADNTAQALACTTTFPKGAEVQVGVTVVSDGAMGAHTTVSERRGGIGAYGIQIVLGTIPNGGIQPSEQDTSGATATATSLPTPTTTTDSSAMTTSSSSGGVSTGVAIGIGVGSAAAALIAAASVGLFFFTRWRRKKRLRRRGTTRTAGTRSGKGRGGGPSSRSGPPVPPKDIQPHYELSEEACSYVAASAASDWDHRFSSRHMSTLSDSKSAGAFGATPPPGQPVEPERARLSSVWHSPNQSPSQSPGPSGSASHVYSYNRPVEHPGHRFAELEAVVPMEAASSDMPSWTEPSLMTPSRWQSLQSLKSCTGSPAPTTNLQELPEGGTISSTTAEPAGMESVTNSWASRGRYGERGMSPMPWI